PYRSKAIRMISEPTFTIGIEEEYIMVDRDTRNALREVPAGLMDQLVERLGQQVSTEFLQCQVEVGTRVCHSVEEARDDLCRLRQVVANVRWHWPHSGTVIANFSSSGKVNKGIDIAGNPGDAVKAAADGSVVYAGNGLLGYGNLIIVNHNEHYLSAYAHNRKILVKEGEGVKAGQVIAELGNTGTDKPKLHFEIRKNGNPVDPSRYLPRR
uniref:glutamate-cysteine ligase family protein n=1 Tax=Marinobacter nauticus TaxID=2743 RepID=UPI0032B300D9